MLRSPNADKPMSFGKQRARWGELERSMITFVKVNASKQVGDPRAHQGVCESRRRGNVV